MGTREPCAMPDGSVSTSHDLWPLFRKALEDRAIDDRFNIQAAAAAIRNPDRVCQPSHLVAFKDSSLTPASAILREVSSGAWRIRKREFDLDDDGCGRATYHLDLAGWPVVFHVVSEYERDAGREGRLADMYYDGKGILFAQPPTNDEIRDQECELSKLWKGRASRNAIGWTLANRSVNNFDKVLTALSHGEQPDTQSWHPSARYLMRNAGYYGNGKVGSALWKSLNPEHPLRQPYFPEMLSLYLWREFGFDLLDHLSAQQHGGRLSEETRCSLGLGNSSGMGMIGVLTRWPWWVDAWVSVREACRALLVTMPTAPADAMIHAFRREVASRQILFAEGLGLESPPHVVPAETVANDLDRALAYIDERASADSNQAFFRDIFNFCNQQVGPDAAESVHAAAISVSDDLTACGRQVIARLMEPVIRIDETQRIDTFQHEVRRDYGWVRSLNHVRESTPYYFLYKSSDNGEHRRDVRRGGTHEEHEVFIDVPSEIESLLSALVKCREGMSIGEFLYQHPEYRDITERVHSLRRRPFAEFRDRCTRKEFLPLWVIGFYLSMLGLQMIDPKTTRWIRGVFFRGAQRMAVGGDASGQASSRAS